MVSLISSIRWTKGDWSVVGEAIIFPIEHLSSLSSCPIATTSRRVPSPGVTTDTQLVRSPGQGGAGHCRRRSTSCVLSPDTSLLVTDAAIAFAVSTETPRGTLRK